MCWLPRWPNFSRWCTIRQRGCQTLWVPDVELATSGYLQRLRDAGPNNPPPKSATRVLIVLVGVSLALAWAGDLLLAGIIEDSPIWLIALNPRTRNLILASPNVAMVPFFVVGFLRLTASDPLYFLLGHWHGDKAIAWTERRSRTYGPLVRDMEKWFAKLAYVFIFFMPNNIISALSGAAGIKARTFLALNFTGTIFRLVLIWKLGERFESPIQRVVDAISEYKIPILIVSALMVAWTIFGEFKGDSGEISSLKDLTDIEGSGTPEGTRDN